MGMAGHRYTRADCHRSRASQGVSKGDFCPAERTSGKIVPGHLLLASQDHPNLSMILKIFPNPRSVVDDLDIVFPKQLPLANAGKLEQLW